MGLMMPFSAVRFFHEMSWMRSGTELSQCLGCSYLLLHIRAVVFVLCVDRKNFRVHSFNAYIIPVFGDCLSNYFSVFLSFDI